MFASKTKNFHECKLASLSKEMVDSVIIGKKALRRFYKFTRFNPNAILKYQKHLHLQYLHLILWALSKKGLTRTQLYKCLR